MPTSIRSPLVLSVALLGACGGGDPAATGMPEADMARVITPYPEGPYGNRPGETLEDLIRPGYRLSPAQRDSTLVPWSEDISLGDFHANPACACLLITIGTTWCGACQTEQPELVMDVQNDPSFCVLGILQEGAVEGSRQVTREDVDAWTRKYRQSFYVIQGDGSTSTLWAGYGGSMGIGLPFQMIVKPSTMVVADTPRQGSNGQIYREAKAACAAP